MNTLLKQIWMRLKQEPINYPKSKHNPIEDNPLFNALHTLFAKKDYSKAVAQNLA